MYGFLAMKDISEISLANNLKMFSKIKKIVNEMLKIIPISGEN